MKTKLHSIAACAAIASAYAFSNAGAAVLDLRNLAEPEAATVGPLSASGFSFLISADTFSYDFNGLLDPNDDELTLLNDNDAVVTIDANGIGVDSHFLDLDRVDGSINNDILVFDFGEIVQLNRIDFVNVDGNDDFVLFAVDDPSDLSSAIAVDSLAIAVGDNDEGSFVFASGVEGRYFGIGARGLLDGFRVSELRVSAVPVPPALPLMAAGMAGIAALRRRKRA